MGAYALLLSSTLLCHAVNNQMLYLEIDDDMEDLCPKNRYLKRGSTVYIGLDKTTKLEAVFQQFCIFVNKEAYPTDHVKLSDFEFVHCTILDKTHTVETSAMMKNDRIKVRKDSSKARSQKEEAARLQRESDRKYFNDLRQLLQNSSPDFVRGCDVILDCKGKVVDERGFSQNVLVTAVRANSAMLSKRCPWLAEKIQDAKDKLKRWEDTTRRRDEMTNSEDGKSDVLLYKDEIVKALLGIDDESGSSMIVIKAHIQANMPPDVEWNDADYTNALIDGVHDGDLVEAKNCYKLSDAFTRRKDTAKDESFESNSDNDDAIVPSFPADRNDVGGNHSIKVEDDDDEEDDGPSLKTTKLMKGGAVVTLDHSPEAVKLLLEYSYTNRVNSLGSNAFSKASRHVGLNGVKEQGPVPPFRKLEWPKNGLPTISLHLALAGIALAEEAQMARFSLMCEIAASQLIKQDNVLDVLCACQSQQQKTGNRLPVLRKAAMLNCIYKNGSTGIDRLMEKPHFKNNYEEKSSLVVPSLLEGIVELLPSSLLGVKDWQKKKEKMEADTTLTLLKEDNIDKSYRETQRKKYRQMETIHRRVEAAFGLEDLAASSPRATHSFREVPPPIRLRAHKRKSRSNAHGTQKDSKRIKRERPV